MATIGDYWDEETISQVVDLLKEYQDIFPTSFSKMKGIAWELGEMHIQLKPDAKPVKKRPYWLNPKYKEKVKQELDKMLATGIIIPVEELEWISPMVVQDKKTGESKYVLTSEILTMHVSMILSWHHSQMRY